ncbi:MAG: DNA sulfur modification protein DndB [Segniliparus sp.]|uniref:DNA sulfur modification protein DndB n=1 Tax=Segniliparus sp. TaxID=2804064 RepID=UPI003F2E6DA7
MTLPLSPLSTFQTALDLSAGYYVKGIPLSEKCFLATTHFDQVRVITRNPKHFKPGAKLSPFDSDELERERTIHELIQRALVGNKAKNVPSYRQYIESVALGGVGILPPIHLWSEDGLRPVLHDGIHYLLVPNGEHLLAIDGETQLAAHWELGEHPATPEIRKAHRDFPLACVIHHGVPVITARQYFHDLNVLAVRPNTSLGLSMDAKDPVMQVVSDVEAAVKVLQHGVEKQARQLKKNDHKIVTLQALRQMVVNIAKGISGVQYGARPAPIDEAVIPDLKEVSIKWIERYFNEFLSEITYREKYLAGTGSVLASVGAMGEILLRQSPDERAETQDRLITMLREVNWEKGEHWIGIAGNFTPTGVFSVKGTKEVAYAVYNALTDPENSSYRRVRSH